jgi:predicted aspartyl protease
VEIDEKVVAVRSNVIVNDTIINAIIDTGAALNIITSKLLDTLGLEIEESSKTSFIIANGERQASLVKN